MTGRVQVNRDYCKPATPTRNGWVAHEFEWNAYHIYCDGLHIRGNSEHVPTRITMAAMKAEWMDAKHNRVIAAIAELESALLDIAPTPAQYRALGYELVKCGNPDASEWLKPINPLEDYNEKD